MNIPYFALRSSPTPIVDLRCGGNGKALRRCEDLTYLTAESSTPTSTNKYYLYEAQFCCVVSGLHNARWEAYGFSDTYYDDSERTESYEVDPEDSDDQVPYYEDPLRPGNLVNEASMDPRRYYLDVLASQVKRIRDECLEARDHIRQNINDSVSFAPIVNYAEIRALPVPVQTWGKACGK